LCVRVRVGIADVSEPCRPKERIGYGMQNHVGIGMANEPAGVRDGNAAEDKRAAFGQPVRIVSAADSERHLLPLRALIGNLRGL
jgi:hypothetical protein